jgi:transposase
VGFQVLPRRWVVERFLAWINRNRRLAKDFEGSIPSANAFLYAACVMLHPPTRSFGLRFESDFFW